MCVHAEEERAANGGLQAVFGHSLGDGENVRFVETAVEGASPVTAGAEGDALAGLVDVRLLVVGGKQRGDVGQACKRGRLAGLDDAALTRRRRSTLGFVFQFHHLLPAFTALENVTLPALMRDGAVSAERRAQAMAMLQAVGLEQAAAKRPGALSGGMQQRVA